MNEKIKCPNCGEEFDVEDALSSKIEQHLKKEYEKKLEKQLDKINHDKKDLEKEKEKLDKLKEEHDDMLKKELKKHLEKEREKIEKIMRDENSEKLRELEEENEKSRKENLKLKKKEIEILKKEKEFSTREEELKLQFDKRMMEMEDSIADKAKKKEREAFELERMKYQKKIDDAVKAAEDMKRKAEQGSMQLQGETQEIAIEKYLQEHFNYDRIEEIKKGARGGDCIQTVYNDLGQECGSIYYESKLTKHFSNEWIDKFRSDMQEKGANIGVLVTQAMPAGMERAGQVNGIWICSFNEFKSLSVILRESLIQISGAVAAQDNKGDKMSLLYDFLTGHEFRHQVEAIVEGFTDMKADIEKEKRSMARLWKQREKQIEKVVFNTTNMYGAIKGIGGKAIPTVQSLELAEPDDIDDDDEMKDTLL